MEIVKILLKAAEEIIDHLDKDKKAWGWKPEVGEREKTQNGETSVPLLDDLNQKQKTMSRIVYDDTTGDILERWLGKGKVFI